MTTTTIPNETRLRLRAFINAQYTVLLVVCLLITAIGGGIVYTTHVAPGTETQTQTVSSWTVETGHTHSAEVTEPNPVFPVGDELTNREVYFITVSPDLDVNAEVTYTAESAEDVDVVFNSTLVMRNVGEEGVTYWEENETIDSTTVEDVEPNETVSAPFTLDSEAINERILTINEQLGASSGETEIFVVTDVELSGMLNGEEVTYTRPAEFDISLSPEDATYTVSDSGVQSDSDEQQVTETVEQTYGPLRGIGGPILFVVGLLGVAGLGYVRYESAGGISEAERAYLSFRDDRSEFDEWITQVRLPPELHDRSEAHTESLRDLVDFAIDNDTGVVEDPNTGAFHVVSGEFIYTYRPPLAPCKWSDDGREIVDSIPFLHSQTVDKYTMDEDNGESTEPSSTSFSDESSEETDFAEKEAPDDYSGPNGNS